MYNLKWNIWLQYDLFLSVVKPFLKQTRTVFKKTAIGLLHFHPTALALGVHSESLLIIRKQNLQRNRISVKLPLKWLLCWPQGTYFFINDFKVLLLSKKLQSEDNTFCVSGCTVSLCLFRVVLTWPKKFELVSARALFWVWILRLKHHFWHLACRAVNLMVSTKRKETTRLFCSPFCLQT